MALVGYDIIEELRGVAQVLPEADDSAAATQPADVQSLLLPQPTAEFVAQFAEPV